MQLELLSGYPDFVGRRTIWCGFGSGPAHYNETTHDIVLFPRQTFYIDAIIPALTLSGRYVVYGVAKGVGPRMEWALKWVEAEGGEEVANGHNLSEEKVQLAGFGGQF